jgi:hypothetical protein
VSTASAASGSTYTPAQKKVSTHPATVVPASDQE